MRRAEHRDGAIFDRGRHQLVRHRRFQQRNRQLCRRFRPGRHGDFTTSVGTNSVASGYAAQAFGVQAQANGDYSLASGFGAGPVIASTVMPLLGSL